MARPDGRIEKGQRLSSAISARAWNRAQEAADRVLGVTPGVEVTAAQRRQRQITFPVQFGQGTPFTFAVISCNFGVPNLSPTVLSSPFENTSGAWPAATDKSLPDYCSGSVHGSATAGAWGICEPKLAANGVAECVFSGFTFARVRVRNSGHRCAIPSMPKENTPLVQGCLDSTECECEGAARIIGYGGDVTVDSIYWALVLL
jgi:hypothetical protein